MNAFHLCLIEEKSSRIRIPPRINPIYYSICRRDLYKLVGISVVLELTGFSVYDINLNSIFYERHAVIGQSSVFLPFSESWWSVRTSIKENANYLHEHLMGKTASV